MKSLLVIISILFALQAVAEDKWEGGKTYNKIVCEKNKKWSYALYLPKKYDPDRKEAWPVMFIWTPGGGKANTLKRLIPGAELTDCILVCSIETSNNNKNNSEGMATTLEDVITKFKCDSNFIFCTGMSGGGRRTYGAAAATGKGKLFTGVFPCGAGEPNQKLARNAFYFGASGTTCYNREQMAVSFISKIKNKGKLVWTPGGHVWAGEKIYTHGFAYLYANNLNKVRNSPELYALYYEDFCKELKTIIDKEQDKFYKYELLSCLALVSRNKDQATVRKELNTLKSDKEIRAYLYCQTDLEKFLKKYYTNYYSKKGPVSDKAVKAMNKLIEKYKDLPYVEILKQLIKKAP